VLCVPKQVSICLHQRGLWVDGFYMAGVSLPYTNRYDRSGRWLCQIYTYLFPVVSDKNILYELGDFNLNAAQLVSILPLFYCLM
jgi:hypothetical protein